MANSFSGIHNSKIICTVGELRNKQALAQINPSMARLKKPRDGEKNAAAKKVRMEDLSKIAGMGEV